jgi:small-conductance mechanosensitive channel
VSTSGLNRQGVFIWRRLIGCAALALAAILLCAAGPTSALAAEPAVESTPPVDEKAQSTGPVPLAELSVQAEAASTSLRQIAAAAAADDTIALIERELPALTREIDARARETTRIVARLPSLELLRSLERSWQSARAPLAGWSTELEERVEILDRYLTRIAQLEKKWTETLVFARKEQAPPEVIARVESLLASISRTHDVADTQRTLALKLQARVAAQLVKVDEAIETIRSARGVTLNRVFSRDSPPLWDYDALEQARGRIASDSQETREAQSTTLQTYIERRSDRVLIHLALFVVLSGLLYWARQRLNAWVKTDPELQHASAVVAYPIATSLVLTLMASRWIYPQAPRLMWAFIGAAALVPAVLVLRRLAPSYLRPLLYAVLALFFIDQLRGVMASIDLVPRIVFVVEMLGGALFLLWFRKSSDRAYAGDPTQRHSRLVRVGALVACVLFVATALANISGYVALANLVGNAVLRSMYFGLLLYTVLEIIDALIAMALRARPLTLFGMVRRHRELLRRRVRMLLNALAFVWWLLLLFERLALRDRVISAAHAALTAELNIGAITISLADILSFILAVWASFVVSRFVQFVLDEEVYPHARLKRGLPYAISRTLHYAILVAGFFLAMGVIGVDMTKFTILAGAFTVGVGFGLQNIFNNFVSGLILLFERPVQVGDVIQMDDAAGVVERIGIRASIVRTPGGSEVIVPNGKLISERLVNWTFSDRQRGIEVPVSVVLGSDPARVISLLERVASEHPSVLKTPPPEALLVRLGPDWMGFELRAATEQVEDWMKARSELAVAVTAALKAENIQLR